MKNRQEQKIMSLVRERLTDAEIDLIETVKNNDCQKRGFQIWFSGESEGIVVYQETLEAVCGTSCTAEEAAEYICHVVEEAVLDTWSQEKIWDWEKAKRSIYKKIVNYGRNCGRLDMILHRRYLDLAEVYYLRIPVADGSCGTMELSERMLGKWGIREEELEKWAKRNMDADGYQVQSIQEFLGGAHPSEESQNPELYLILNRRGEFGAGVLSSPGVMKELMEQIGKDCYILPSSVHELLAVPSSSTINTGELCTMVKEVNQTAVLPEEFLSDSVYFCPLNTGEVELCCGM